MKTVKITKNGETKTVEKGAVHIYANEGWVIVKEPTYNPTANPYSSATNNR